MSDFNPDDVTAADEVLQIMFWLRGEHLAQTPDIGTLARLSTIDPQRLERALEGLVRRGLVVWSASDVTSGYRLTDEGVREGGRRFADEFADMTKPGHGECNDPDCECHRSGSTEDCRHRVGRIE